MDANSGSIESLDDNSQSEMNASPFEDDHLLRLLEDEPESWANIVDKKVCLIKKNNDNDVDDTFIFPVIIIITNIILNDKIQVCTMKKKFNYYYHHNHNRSLLFFFYLDSQTT